MAYNETPVQHKPKRIPVGSGDQTRDQLIGSSVLPLFVFTPKRCQTIL